LITYSASKEDTPELFEFFREIDELKKKSQINPDFNRMKYKKQIAHTILNYYENIREDAPIWKAIHLLYLYQLTALEEDIILPRLAPYENMQKTEDLMINANGLLELNGKSVEDEGIFTLVQPLLKSKISLKVNCHESTSFYRYYEVINALHECVELLRDEQAIEIYKKNYVDLTTPEFRHIHELIPGHIIENAPH
jgi:hypothetical protein